MIYTKFKENNLELQLHKNYFVLTESKQQPDKLKEKVIEILEDLHYCYLASDNRLNGGLITFSVTPYLPPAEFRREEVKVTLSSKDLWSSIESEKLRQTESNENSQMVQNIMSTQLGIVNYLMMEMFEKCPSGGSALDLGCGLGVNSRPLLKKGWSVTAIDRYKKALQEYRKLADNEALEKLTLIEADVTKHPLPKNSFNLVIATQVLNYLEPKSIRPLMQKIYDALLPNGTFVGTLWFDDGGETLPITKWGVYLYKKETAPALLVHSGFTIEQCIPYFDADRDHSIFVTYQFVAKKAFPLTK